MKQFQILLGGACMICAIGSSAFATESLTVDVEGNVGIGIATPSESLHVLREDGTAQILVEEINAAVSARTLFTLSNPGNTKFEILNSNVNESWAFTNSGIDFRMSRQGSGVVEFRVDNDGNGFVAGDLQVGGLVTELSDRNAKTNISPVDAQTVLDKVSQMPINQWAYKDSPDTHHIGPMAQDFRAAFGTGADNKRLATMDVGGVAIAAIQALAARDQGLEAENADLRAQNEALELRLIRLEAMVSNLTATAEDSLAVK